MKKNVLIFGLLLLSAAIANANVFRVNNLLTTDKAQKIFNTVKEAHDAAEVLAGDTLMIEGTSKIHANIVITKRLVLIGPGFLLNENPETQANVAPALFSKITVNASAAGSIFIGLTFAETSSANRFEIEAPNVIVMRCYSPYDIILLNGANNVQIIQNLLEGVYYSNSGHVFTGIVLKNNIISGSLNLSSSVTYPRTFSLVENNIFLRGSTLQASTFRNNILVGTSTFTIQASSIANNLTGSGQLPATNGNQTYDASNLFVGKTGNSTDGQYKIKPGSPYLTAGYNNTQPGIFGGTTPYVLSGIPPVPSVYEFSADNFGSKQTGLPVQIKVKANQ